MKNKFLIVFIMFLLILSIFTSNSSVFASDNTDIYEDFTFTYKGVEYTLPNFPFADKPFLLLASNADGSVPSIEYFQVRVYEGTLSEGEICSPYIFKTSNRRWNNSFVIYTKDNAGNISIVNKCATFSVYGYSIANDTYSSGYSGNWCSFDSDNLIYLPDENYTNVFVTAKPSCIYSSSVTSNTTLNNLTMEEVSNPFFQPPLEITETLVEATTKAQVMEQMKAMIVGFLKYLVALVISLLAFWKGWKFLSTQLKKA